MINCIITYVEYSLKVAEISSSDSVEWNKNNLRYKHKLQCKLNNRISSTLKVYSNVYVYSHI